MSARRRAKVVPLPRPADELGAGATIDLGGDMSASLDISEGSCWRCASSTWPTGTPPRWNQEEKARRSWLYEALLDAVEHEQDRLQALAPLVYQQARR